jgi:hypothetical protein
MSDGNWLLEKVTAGHACQKVTKSLPGFILTEITP